MTNQTPISMPSLDYEVEGVEENQVSTLQISSIVSKIIQDIIDIQILPKPCIRKKVLKKEREIYPTLIPKNPGPIRVPLEGKLFDI